MENEIKVLLDKEIKSELDHISTLTPGTDGHTRAIDNLTKLYKLRLEEIKLEDESHEKESRREMESEHHERDVELKERQIDNEVMIHDSEDRFKRDQSKAQFIGTAIDIGIKVITTSVMLVAYNCWLNRGLRFEETGTIANPHTRNLMTKMLPNLKS